MRAVTHTSSIALHLPLVILYVYVYVYGSGKIYDISAIKDNKIWESSL